MSIDISQLLNLPAAEKLHIIGELWDSLDVERIELPQWQIDEIERREREHQKNPGAALSWDQVKDKILRRND